MMKQVILGALALRIRRGGWTEELHWLGFS